MEVLAYGMLGFAPGLFWLWVLRRKDDLEPEPKRLVLAVFGLGCGAALGVLWLRPYLEPLVPWEPVWLRDLVDAFVVTAGFEELWKLLAFLLGAFLLHRELDEPLDGIIYGAAAGLGFASVENFVYIMLIGDPMLVLPRAFTATLAHVACSGSLGFFIGLTRFCRGVDALHLVVIGLVLSIGLHGIYDYFLLVSGSWWLVSLLLALPVMAVLLGLKIRWARAHSPQFHPELAGS